MLWAAGQGRMTRERNDRRADLFVAARDAELQVGVSTGRLTAVGPWHLPPYVEDSPEQRQAINRRGLRQLIADFPANVATGTEFVN